MIKVDKMLRVEEVALLVGVSVQTLNNWYRWKKLNPEHELAKKLPEFVQQGARQQRYWKTSCLWQITEFKNSIPHGRNGILGEVTQPRKKKEA